MALVVPATRPLGLLAGFGLHFLVAVTARIAIFSTCMLIPYRPSCRAPTSTGSRRWRARVVRASSSAVFWQDARSETLERSARIGLIVRRKRGKRGKRNEERRSGIFSWLSRTCLKVTAKLMDQRL